MLTVSANAIPRRMKAFLLRSFDGVLVKVNRLRSRELTLMALKGWDVAHGRHTCRG